MTVSNLTQHNHKWTGRDDVEDGVDGKRVHHITQVVDCLNIPSERGVALIGFETDAGVAQNKGRVGAKQSPNLIRQALANMAWHNQANVYDLGNVTCEGDDLTNAQTQCAEVVTQALKETRTIVLGGGHEIAWSSFQGLANHLDRISQDQPPRIGIINFDAHFDLREHESEIAEVKPSSGTPFNQIHQWCQIKGWPFHYACLGVSAASNTQALFKNADALNVWYLNDHQITYPNLVGNLEKLSEFIKQCDYLYLTIDLDVFPAATAPGVSAPAARGVSYDNLAPLLELVLQHPDKLLLADIAEYNPNYDIDQQTARLAARLCWDIANAMANA